MRADGNTNRPTYDSGSQVSRKASKRPYFLPLQIDHIHIIKTTELTAAHLGADGTLRTSEAAGALFRATTHRPSLDSGSGQCVP